MEEESGLELRLGLSLGGSKSNPNPQRNPDATPPNPKRNPKPDEGSSTQNFTNLFQNHNNLPELASEVRTKQNGGEGQGGPSSILIDLTKSSHLSINTGEGSVGENDDVAESHETEGSNYNSDNKGGASASGVTMNSFSGGVPVSFQAANHVMMPSGGERAMPAQQVAFGYSSVQLPTLETNPVWVYNNHTGSKELAEEDERKSQGSMKPNQDNHISASPSSQTEQINTTKPNPNPNPNPNPPIRRGLSPNITFGGSGSRPDLPWVTTTGSGPGGKCISGVTYKHGRDQIRIVCACHGTHMSPEEFVKHAS